MNTLLLATLTSLAVYQRIERLSVEDAAWWQQHSDAGHLPKCETCGKEFSV